MTRHVRAAFTPETITVYQAYADRIAIPALSAGTFVAPFKVTRMTWIKPSFLWMMYRSGWATKTDQDRVLAIDITREGFEWALSHSCLSHYDRNHFTSEEDWRAQLRSSPVRIQWDPDRDLNLNPLPGRAIQIGLSGEAVTRYVDDWIVDIKDVTQTVREIHRAVTAGHHKAVEGMIPREREYPLPDHVRDRIGSE
ncbi:DUF4291 domain-containing protein [Streptomyces ficellus]|uniref:DUF4291 domain-containing protein n=1 Tax=Streptomyces ficellus TaxID=1977088 RepID=A0ABT7Z3G0_9ACTN|nr:DUF4291 domain-containing protein [Streptomyces ficellus]MDN3293817.1 DUF4291 domain-containing protein [Streptomyces ficellus]